MFYGTEALCWRLTSTNHTLSREAAHRYELSSAIRQRRSSGRGRKRTDRPRGLAARRTWLPLP